MPFSYSGPPPDYTIWAHSRTQQTIKVSRQQFSIVHILTFNLFHYPRCLFSWKVWRNSCPSVFHFDRFGYRCHEAIVNLEEIISLVDRPRQHFPHPISYHSPILTFPSPAVCYRVCFRFIFFLRYQLDSISTESDPFRELLP